MYRTIAYGILIASVAYILMFVAANAEEQPVLTIEKAAEHALEHNFSIRISGHDRTIAEKNFTRGNAGFLPILELESGYSFNLEDARLEFADGEVIDRDLARSENFNAGIRLNYPLFTGFERQHRYNSFRDAYLSAREWERFQIQEVLQNLVTLYYEIRRLEKLMEATESSIVISRERLAIAERKSELGSGSRTEVLQARADLNRERSLLLEHENQLEQNRIELNRLIGRNVNTPFQVSEDLVFRNLPDQNEILQQAMSTNPALSGYEYQQSQAMYLANAEKSKRFPTIGFTTGYLYGASASEAGVFSSTQSLGWNVGVSLRMNLFDGFNTSRRIEQSMLQFQQAELLKEQEKDRILAGLEETRIRYRNALVKLDLERENSQVVQENVEIALQQYEVGLITGLELKESQITLLDSEKRLRDAELEAKIAETKLLRLSGQLDQMFTAGQ